MGGDELIDVRARSEQEALMVRYLLGSATEKERTEIEERLFSASEDFDHLVALEDSLIDDYVTGRLPAEERDAFEEAFLPHRSADVQFSRALIQAITKKKLNRPAAVAPERPRPARPSDPIPGRRSLSAGLAIAALILLAISVALFFGRQSVRDQLSQSNAELAEVKEQNEAVRRELSQQKESAERELETERSKRIDAESRLDDLRRPDSVEPHDFKEIILTAAFTFRGSTSPLREIQVPAGLRWLRFKVPVPADEFESYRITIRLPGEDAIIDRHMTRGEIVQARLPVIIGADELQPGDYILTLYGEGGAAQLEDLEAYGFRIKR